MSLSMLFRSNVTAHAHTSEEFLKLTKKCMERVQKLTTPSIIFTSPKFNYGQCKYLADKLKLAVESAQHLSTTEAFENCLEVFKLLHSLANVVENFIQTCCQDAWIQAAIMLTNVSEHISSLGFNLEVLTQSFLGRLILTTVDGVYQAEVKIVEVKASDDRETLLRVVNGLLWTRTSTDRVYRLAVLLLERLQQPMHYQAHGMPRLFQEDKESLIEMEQLGKGSFATVFKASWQGIEVAKKTFYARDSPDFEKEVSILQVLSHPNITSLLGYAKDDRECFMVMELMDQDLFSLIQRRMKQHKTRGFPFGIWEAIDIMLQVGRGMQYLHDMRIVHRDLKSMNILVRFVKAKNLETEYVLAKVSDFGLSKTKERSFTYSNQTPNMGTARWMAPEMIHFCTPERSIEISNDDAMVAKYPFSSDVHSFAMVCYEILTGELPYFEVRHANQVKDKVLKGDRPELPSHCPLNLKSLIERCWNADASKRPCFGEVCTELRHLKCLLLISRMTSYEDAIYERSYSQANSSVFLGLHPGSSSGGRKFTFAELKKSTSNFSESHKIGEGGFGTVYQGRLRDGSTVAIKRAKMDASGRRLSHEFQAEVETLSQMAHLNLVKLVGYLDEKDERIVVSEYVTNGNLRQHLDGVPYGIILDMSKRLNIAIDVATALTYLHYYSDRPIIHRNVKSSDILITDTFRAKVADFGFPRFGPSGDDTIVSTQVKGTTGYLDPEYLNTFQLDVKSDVYSFGILLVELFTGRYPIELRRTSNERVTVRWAFRNFVEGRLKSIIDPKIQFSAADLAILDRIFELAFTCAAPTRVDRPNMRECKEVLWDIRKDYRI